MRNKLQIIYKHNKPYGIRDENGFLFFFVDITKYPNQEERYREEVQAQYSLADYLLSTLETEVELAALRSLLSDAMKALEPFMKEAESWGFAENEARLLYKNKLISKFYVGDLRTAAALHARIKATLTGGEADKPATKVFSGKCICTGLDEFPFDPNPDCPRHGSL